MMVAQGSEKPKAKLLSHSFLVGLSNFFGDEKIISTQYI
jgi:hypothetical protein